MRLPVADGRPAGAARPSRSTPPPSRACATRRSRPPPCSCRSCPNSSVPVAQFRHRSQPPLALDSGHRARSPSHAQPRSLRRQRGPHGHRHLRRPPERHAPGPPGALPNQQRAARAIAESRVAGQIVPVEVRARKGPIDFEGDEYVRAEVSLARPAKMKPAFGADGSATAGQPPSARPGRRGDPDADPLKHEVRP
ncbi:hypothetical protein HBN77_16220 [Pseudomonas sp. WS 5018]|nr:hypothetical protein [Pseudomonas sp. WS 5018]